MFNWLSTVFPRRAGLRPAPHVQAVALHNSFRWPNLAEAEAQSKLYQQSPWVYIAVNRIAEAAALVPLRVHPRFPQSGAGNRVSPAATVGEPALVPPLYAVERGLGGEVSEVHHPLGSLLDAPNPYMSRFELIEQTLGMLELTGDAYWFLSGDSSGVPTEIWPLRPDRVSIVPDPAAYIKGYIYEIDGQRIPLLPLEVVHFKRWHPANDYYGLSALEAARVAVTSDRAMAEWNKNTFGKDNGVPAGVVTIKNTINDADFERVKREWRQSYGGPQRTTAFLRAGDVEWQNIGLNHNELDFLNGRRAHRDEILNIFGIPVGLISENATEANAKVAERLFIERTLWPKLVRIAQKITQDLLPFWPGTYVAQFDDIRPTDTQARLDEIRTAYPVLSINEIRQRYYSLPATLWGRLPVGAQKTLTPTEERTSDNYDNDVGTAFLPSASDSPSLMERGSGGEVSAAAPHSINGKAVGMAYIASENGSASQPLNLQHLRNFSHNGHFTSPQDDDDADINSVLGTHNSVLNSALSELRQWERFALKRLGKTRSRPFEVRVLPPEIAFELSASLLAATTADDVHAAFAAAHAALQPAAEGV